MTLAFTLCSNNYLAQAITLGNSLIFHNPACKFVIGLVDRKNSSIDYSDVPFEIVEVENIGIFDFKELYLKYNITELNTAVKPFYFHYFFSDRRDITSVIYLDPDILVYSPLKEVEKELMGSEIIITPHFTTPLNDNKLQTEEDFLNAGLYNLGFIAVKNSPEGNRMIHWWAERLRNKAFIDLKRGLFTDQIWINFVPLFFKKVKILNHPGYNLAYWNLHERLLSEGAGEYLVNEKYPLVFYHFSGFNPLIPEILSKYQNRYTFEGRPDVLKLFIEYSEKLYLNGYKSFIDYPNVFSEIKNKLDLKKRKAKVHSLSFLIRVFRIIVLKVSKRHDLLLD
jgi:hypothetical protein